MKQKYTLLIADMEINVVTDEPQESVEYIVGILDRKIREIILKNWKPEGNRCRRKVLKWYERSIEKTVNV